MKINKLILAPIAVYASISTAEAISVDSVGANIGYGKIFYKQEDKQGSMTLSNQPDENYLHGELYTLIGGVFDDSTWKPTLNYMLFSNSEFQENLLMAGINKYFMYDDYDFYAGALIGVGELEWKYNPLTSTQDNSHKAKSIAGALQVGSEYLLTNSLALGVNAKAYMHDYKLTLQTNTQEALIKHPYAFSVAVGLRYSFGDNGKKIPVVVPPKVDSDRDGVEDKYDTCAQTPPGVIVDVNGCELDTDEDGIVNSQDSCPATPIGLAVDKQGCLLDFDQDGVVNTLDKCDDTPARVSVDEQGCPVDEDKDGIADFQDLCLLTPSGFSVDENGCEKAFILKITFASNSFVIEKEYYHEIQKFVSFLNAFPEYDTVVEAHTDSIGTQEGNNILSYKRAKSVYKELVKMGIQASRITYKGMGSQAPIASNETEEGKQLNRRIEAILIKKER